MKVRAFHETGREITIETELDDPMYYYCSSCRKETSHKTLVKVNVVNGPPRDTFIKSEHYRISECSGCHSVYFVEEMTRPKDMEWLDSDQEKGMITVYPDSDEIPLTESRLCVLSLFLPSPVKEVYTETVVAIHKQLFTLAGIGLRAVLDAICRDKKIGDNDDSLATRLRIMAISSDTPGKDSKNAKRKHLNIITLDELNYLNVVKELGNDSAHEGIALTLNDAKRALEIVEHILNKLYMLPKIKQEFEDNKQDISFVDAVFEPKTEEK